MLRTYEEKISDYLQLRLGITQTEAKSLAFDIVRMINS